jgi:hypothetical protein
MIKFKLLATLLGLIILASMFGSVGQSLMQTYATYARDYPYSYDYPFSHDYSYYNQYFYPYLYPLYPSYYNSYNYPFYRYYYPSYYYPINRYYIYPFDSYPLGTFGLIAGGNYPVKVAASQPSNHK